MRGWSASASASEAPSFTRCLTAPITFFKRGCSICSTSAVSDSGSVMPAPISVASWRVAIARSWEETREPKMARRSTSRDSVCPSGSDPDCAEEAAAAAPSALRASVRKMPSLRSTVRRALRLSASFRPRTDLPASVNPLYSNTGIGEKAPRSGEVLLRHAEDLGDGGDAAQHLAPAVLHQRPHSLVHRGALDRAAVGLLHRQLADRVVDQHEFVDPATAVVAGAVARVATDRAIDHARLARLVRPDSDLAQLFRRGKVGLAALLSEHAHPPLRQDADERRADEVRPAAHGDEPRDGARGVVGVDGAEDEVSGERSLDGDLRRFPV